MTREELIEAMAKAVFEVNDGSFTTEQELATAALSAIEADGFAIVPVVASEAMRVAGADNLFGAANDDWGQDAAAIYSAMIQAAKDEMK
jgi:hypothetical protein